VKIEMLDHYEKAKNDAGVYRGIDGWLNGVIVIIKIDVSWSSPVAGYELRISFRTLILGVTGQHALQGHAYALDVLYWTPALCAEQIEADDAI